MQNFKMATAGQQAEHGGLRAGSGAPARGTGLCSQLRKREDTEMCPARVVGGGTMRALMKHEI